MQKDILRQPHATASCVGTPPRELGRGHFAALEKKEGRVANHHDIFQSGDILSNILASKTPVKNGHADEEEGKEEVQEGRHVTGAEPRSRKIFWTLELLNPWIFLPPIFQADDLPPQSSIAVQHFNRNRVLICRAKSETENEVKQKFQPTRQNFLAHVVR